MAPHVRRYNLLLSHTICFFSNDYVQITRGIHLHTSMIQFIQLQIVVLMRKCLHIEFLLSTDNHSPSYAIQRPWSFHKWVSHTHNLIIHTIARIRLEK